MRTCPIPQEFITLIINARDTGDLPTHQGRDRGPGRCRQILDAEEQILNLVDEIP